MNKYKKMIKENKKTNNEIRIFLLFSILIISLFSFASIASAITGKIGNGRMVLYSEIGQKVEKSIRVINDNDKAIRIDILAAGELEKNIELIDKSFVLNPGEEKNAAFTIYSDSVGRNESKINIKFTPIEGNETAVGLSSVIILNTYNKGELPDLNSNVKRVDNSINWTILAVIMSVLLVVVLILLFVFSKKRGENGGGLKKPKFNGKFK